ncbi:unnamed protein product [Meganyctiphanes norvegica]|uniref:Methyltransferase domain-containing protein n=1 Tax=Meganyctiphanes norvegica TaxID=48144 RepID=A0AAV2S5I1_MEGNR
MECVIMPTNKHLPRLFVFLVLSLSAMGSLFLLSLERTKWDVAPFYTLGNHDPGASCHIPPLNDMEEFFQYFERDDGVCNDKVIVGGLGPDGEDNTGGKYVCIDEPFKFRAANCNVLSFGIAKDFSFDDQVETYGCKVLAFDPTNNLPSHQRSPGIQFFNWGLGGFRGLNTIEGWALAKVESYYGILETFGLLETEIDYLKMDIETHELEFFKDIFHNYPQLLNNVKQIGMEIHPTAYSDQDLAFSDFLMEFWAALHRMQCHGFLLADVAPNPVKETFFRWRGKERYCCYEILWINKKYMEEYNNNKSN